MALITIARERGALGAPIAEKLAELLGYRLLDKEIVEHRLLEMGLSQKQLESYDEKKPGFFAALSDVMEDYARCLKIVVFEEAAKGNCVFLGRGTQALLLSVPGVLRVRLVAPEAVRIARLQEGLQISEEDARREMLRADRDRDAFNRHFFDAEWSAAASYHCVLNTENLSADASARVIAGLCPEFVPATASSSQTAFLQDLVNGLNLERFLLREEKIPVHFLSVTCRGMESVELGGIANSFEVVDRIKGILAEKGYRNVVSNIRIGRVSTYH